MNIDQNLSNFDNENEQNENVDVVDSIKKYVYYWPVFLVGIIVCLSLAFIYLRYSRPIYQVTSTLLIKDQKKSVNSGDLLNELDLFGGSKLVENEIEILQSKTLMHTVVKRLNLNISYQAEGRVINDDLYGKSPVNFIAINLDSNYYGHSFILSFPKDNEYLLKEQGSARMVEGKLNEIQQNVFGKYKIDKSQFFVKKNRPIILYLHDPTVIANKFLSNLSVSPKNKVASILVLDYKATSIQRGKDILAMLISVYNEASIYDKNQATQSTLNFIDERLKLISGELTDVEKDVENFKSSQSLTDISSQATLYLDNVKSNDAQLNQINLQIDVIRGIQRYVNSNSNEEKLPTTMGISDQVLSSQIVELSALQLKRDQLLSTTQKDNPLVIPVTKQIETIKSGILTSVQNIYNSLIITKRALEQNNVKYEGSIKRIPGQERQFISIKRQQGIKETLYLYLLQKKEEAALSFASSVTDTRIIDSPFSNNVPIDPKKELIYLGAFALGLILPFGYVYIKNLFNDKISNSQDINKITGAPILGEVALSEVGESIVVSANSRKAIAEQFRAIRTNMQFLYGKRTSNLGAVSLFTSSMSGEGKSFVASNVAAALAISGKKTILLELDLRKPKITKYLALNNKIGFSNFLIGKSEINDIIQPSGINPNLFIIGSGPVPPNPSELLLQKELDELIEYLRNNFDEIIIDTPPIGLVTDAQILARLTDVSIYLVRQGVTSREQIRQLNRIYQSKKFPKLNLILNGIEMGGRYGYGYGYGYGYYSDDLTSKKKSSKGLMKEFFKRF